MCSVSCFLLITYQSGNFKAIADEGLMAANPQVWAPSDQIQSGLRELARIEGVISSPTPGVEAGLSTDTFGPNDKSLGSGANEIERIASDQRKDFIVAPIQHPDIGWTDNPGGHHAIAVLAEQRA